MYDVAFLCQEKVCQLTLQSTADDPRLLCDSIVPNRSGKKTIIPVWLQTNKPEKSAPKANKMEQHVEPKKCHIHRVLNNHQTDSTSLDLDKIQTTDGLQNDDQHPAQRSGKQVNFSGKDNIIVQGEKRSSTLGSPHMQNLCRVFSDVLTASSVAHRTPDGNNLSESKEEDQVVTAEKSSGSKCETSGKTDQPLLLQKSIDVDDAPNPHSNHVKGKTGFVDMVDLNNPVQLCSSPSQQDPCCTNEALDEYHQVNTMATNSSLFEECISQNANDTGEISITGTDAGRSLPSTPAAVVPLALVRNSKSELAASSLSVDTVTKKRKLYPLDRPNDDAYADAQSKNYRLPKENMMSTIYQTGLMKELSQKDRVPRESRVMVNPLATFREKYANKDIIGLPLNSQGELIHMQSSSQVRSEEIFKKKNKVQGPVSSLSVHNFVDLFSSDHHNLEGNAPRPSGGVEDYRRRFPEKRYSSNRSTVMTTAGFSEHQGSSQTEIIHESERKYGQRVVNVNATENPLRAPCYGFREQNEPRSHNDRNTATRGEASEYGFQPQPLPTMRLMGTDVTVGRSSKEHRGLSDIKTWVDKEAITGLDPNLKVPERLPEWVACPTSDRPHENLIRPLEIQDKPSTSKLYHLATDPRSDHALFGGEESVMPGNGSHLVSLSRGYKPESFSYPHSPKAWLSMASVPAKGRGSSHESIKMGLQAPAAVRSQENVRQHWLLSSTHSKHSESLPYGRMHAFPPSASLQDPDRGNYHLQFTSGRLSSQDLPHWLVKEGPHRSTAKSSPGLRLCNSVPKHGDSCGKSAAGMFSLSGRSFSPVMSFSSFGEGSDVRFLDLRTTAPVQSSHTPSFQAAKSNSTSKTCHWTMSGDGDGQKSKYTSLRCFDWINKTRKASTSSNGELEKPTKRHGVCTQGDPWPLKGSKMGELLPSGQNAHRAFKVNDVAKDGHVNACAPSGSSILDAGSRPGPVKLSAGAKHILKPSLKMADQDKPMPIHSTIPFSWETSSGKVPVPQEKSARIYQL